jgi:outer membrane receptor for monomeric catechols
LDGNLAFRTALYHAVKDWERSTDLDASANDSLLTRKRESDGIEFELAGRITDNWEVFSGVSFINAKFSKLAPTAINTELCRPDATEHAKTYGQSLDNLQHRLGFQGGRRC